MRAGDQAGSSGSVDRIKTISVTKLLNRNRTNAMVEFTIALEKGHIKDLQIILDSIGTYSYLFSGYKNPLKDKTRVLRACLLPKERYGRLFKFLLFFKDMDRRSPDS